MNQRVLKIIIIKSKKNKNKKVQRERERGGAFWSFHKGRREKSGVRELGG